MDGQIIGIVFISFFLFLVALLCIFRITRPEAAISWIIRSFIGVSLLIVFFRFGFWNFADFVWWAAIYSLLAALFVFGIFSIMEASITLAIFSRIAREEKLPDKKSIVQKRIDRLLYSGELVRSGKTYSLGKPSYFVTREILLNFFRSCF